MSVIPFSQEVHMKSLCTHIQALFLFDEPHRVQLEGKVGSSLLVPQAVHMMVCDKAFYFPEDL